MTQRHTISLYVILLNAVFILVSCGVKQEEDRKSLSSTPVKITHPRITKMTEYITLNATTVFLRKEIMRAAFPGFVDRIYKNIGDAITSGDNLFDIKTKEAVADTNLQILTDGKIFDGTVKVHAASEGVLTELNYNVGDFVTEGEQIAIVSNPSSMRILLNVPYQYADRLRLGTSCLTILPDGRTLNASIEKIIPTVDASAQTQTYIVRIHRSEKLPAGLNITVRLPIGTASAAVVVPRSALMTNETLDQYWVMKLDNDTTAVRVNVSKGIENDSLVQIITPRLHPTDRVISEGGFGLPDTVSVVVNGE